MKLSTNDAGLLEEYLVLSSLVATCIIEYILVVKYTAYQYLSSSPESGSTR